MWKKRPLHAWRRPPGRRRINKLVCAWCGRAMGDMPYLSRDPSFGICDECVARNFASLYEPEQAPRLEERAVAGPG